MNLNKEHLYHQHIKQKKGCYYNFQYHLCILEIRVVQVLNINSPLFSELCMLPLIPWG